MVATTPTLDRSHGRMVGPYPARQLPECPQHLGGALPRCCLGHGRDVRRGGQPGAGAAIAPRLVELLHAAFRVSGFPAAAVGLPNDPQQAAEVGREFGAATYERLMYFEQCQGELATLQ